MKSKWALWEKPFVPLTHTKLIRLKRRMREVMKKTTFNPPIPKQEK